MPLSLSEVIHLGTLLRVLKFGRITSKVTIVFFAVKAQRAVLRERIVYSTELGYFEDDFGLQIVIVL